MRPVVSIRRLPRDELPSYGEGRERKTAGGQTVLSVGIGRLRADYIGLVAASIDSLRGGIKSLMRGDNTE